MHGKGGGTDVEGFDTIIECEGELMVMCSQLLQTGLLMIPISDT